MSVKEVVKINTTEEVAYKMKPMRYQRAFHGCQLLNSSVVILSGGLDRTEIQQDELYNMTSQEVVRVLNWEDSLRRSNHVLTRMGDKVFAMGGKDSHNNAPSRIVEFNPTSNTWNDLSQELHSSNTSELAVTSFPMASVDCAPNCQCGLRNRKPRIFNGNEAEVRNFPILLSLTIFVMDKIFGNSFLVLATTVRIFQKGIRVFNCHFFMPFISFLLLV